MKQWITGALALAVATTALCLPAMYNGQPFIFPDTAGYVRTVDFVVTKVLSPTFATEWGRGASFSATPEANPDVAETDGAAADDQDRNLWRGRSPYYGLIAYLGFVLGDFWPTVFLHGLLLAFATSLFLRHSLSLNPAQRAGVIAAAAVLTPAGAYVCYLTPDILGGVGLMAAATVFAFHRRMSRLELVSAGLVIALSAVTHMATLLVLLLVAVTGAIVVSVRAAGGSVLQRQAPTLIVGVALAAAVAGEAASGFAAKTLLGRAPLTLPFPMAQLVEDGPGARLMLERCDELDFAVCAFTHALPLNHSNDFLFNPSPEAGVLGAADPATQREIVAEQGAFVTETIKTYPVYTLRTVLNNWWVQFNMFEINEFNYVPVQIRFFEREQLPDAFFARLVATPAYNGDVPIDLASVVFTIVFWVSLAALLAALVMTAGRRVLALRSFDVGLILVIAGVVINAAVCGIIAGPYDRFGGRVAWAIPILAMAGAVALWRDGWGVRVRKTLGLAPGDSRTLAAAAES